MPFVNGLLRKKRACRHLVQYCYLRFGLEKTVELLDDMKDLGFRYATRAGISIGIDDMVIPDEQGQADRRGAQKDVIEVEKQYLDGVITDGERYNKVIDIWSDVTEQVADEMFKEMEKPDQDGIEFNPIYIMADSGARGSKQQIRQLAGMRGLMAKPSGEIIETPDHGQLPRRPDRAAVLHLDARRPQGPGRHGAQDGRLGLPDPPAGRRGAGRDHHRARLRHRATASTSRPIIEGGRDHRAAARPHRRPRQPGGHQRPAHRRA